MSLVEVFSYFCVNLLITINVVNLKLSDKSLLQSTQTFNLNTV